MNPTNPRSPRRSRSLRSSRDPRPSARVLALGTLAVAAAVLSACSGDGPDGDGVDARSYYDDYRSPQTDEYAGSASAPVAESVPLGSSDSSLSPEPPGLPVPGPGEDNVFRDAGQSGFVDAAADPRSTFGLDVDTGSLGVARSLLASGEPVPPESVRVEEWVNGVPYADDVPVDDDLGLAVETATAPGRDDGTQLVRVAVGAREVDPAERPRVNVTLVVDRSGSMDVRERLGLVQSSLAVLADTLRPDDTVSVVSFEDEARPVLEPTPVAETETILDAVEELTPGGSTNLEAGLRLGYEQAREAFDPEGVNVVVLCSDGVANVGATGPGSIVDRIAEEGADGIHLVTVGFGMGNYNDHLMEQLADRGDGFYSYVDTFAEAERLFGEELTTTLVPVAEEARAQVRFDPEVVASYRLVGYDNRAIADEDFADLDVDAGELGSGHRATALYEVRLVDGVEPGTPIGTAELRWRSPGDGAARAVEQPLGAAEDGAAGSVDLRQAAAVADLAELVRGGPVHRERGVTLAELEARVGELSEDGAAGAEDLAELLAGLEAAGLGD